MHFPIKKPRISGRLFASLFLRHAAFHAFVVRRRIRRRDLNAFAMAPEIGGRIGKSGGNCSCQKDASGNHLFHDLSLEKFTAKRTRSVGQIRGFAKQARQRGKKIKFQYTGSCNRHIQDCRCACQPRIRNNGGMSPQPIAQIHRTLPRPKTRMR